MQELFPKIRVRVAELLNGYLEPPEIVPPQLGTRAGVLGAIALASQVARLLAIRSSRSVA